MHNMTINKLSYTKEDADKDVLPVQQPPQQPKESADPDAQIEENLVSESLTEGYTKQEGELSPALYFVISGGEIRERNYLQAIEKKQEFSSLRIIFMTSERKKGGLTPQMMYTHVEAAFSNGHIEQNGIHYDIMEIDAVYLLTDVDHYSNELQSLLPATVAKPYKWIVSNPDFEIWLYYSYFDNPSTDLVSIASLPQSEKSSALKTRNGELKSGGIDPRKAFEEIPVAISNSLKNYKEDEYGIPALFATKMHIFVQNVIQVIGHEYKQWIVKKQLMAQQFKKQLKP